MSLVGRLTRSVLLVALGAGGCYCLYRVLCRRKRPGGGGGGGGGILGRVSGMPVRGSAEAGSEDIPESASHLQPHHLRTLLQMLLSNSDALAQEQVLITLCNSAAFSVNHDVIRNLDGIHIIGGLLSHPNPKIKAGALNALNNLSMNLQNQEQIQALLNEIFVITADSPLNSEVQLAGLRLVINLSVTNNYHEKMEDYFPSLLKLMEEGNDSTKIHIMKILVNLSANPCMTAPLLASKAPSSLAFLFDSSINRDILIRALTFAANLSENLGRDQQHDGHCYNEGSFHALLFKDPAALQRNVAPLLLMPDMEIKEQVSRCIRSAERLKPYCS